MSPIEVVLSLVCCLLGIFIFSRRFIGRNLPPGPWGFPIIGHLSMLGEFPYLKTSEWSKKYGPLISLKFGSYPTVVINDLKLIQKALNDPAFSGRPCFKFSVDRSNGVREGLIFNDGADLTEQRRFALRYLKDFGFGKKSMESIVQDETIELIDHLKKEIGKPFSTNNKFNAAVINSLWTIIAGDRFSQDDPQLQKVLKALNANIQENRYATAISIFMPWIANLAPKLSGYNRILADLPLFKEFTDNPIREHEKTFLENECRDFIDVYLRQSNQTEDPQSCFHPSKTHTSLGFILLDLFIAGAETTSTTLSWTFIYLAKFPEVQEKLQNEIDSVVGKSRLPFLTDRASMPYTQAVIHEVLRFSSLVPFAVFHNTLKDVELGGYTIPKDTMIAPNIHAVHFNKDIWGDPDTFRPERFINDAGDFQKNDALIAFSVGKRACLGETLARDQLFLFTVSLFQRFIVEIDSLNPELDLTPIFSTVLIPGPHSLIIKERL